MLAIKRKEKIIIKSFLMIVQISFVISQNQ